MSFQDFANLKGIHLLRDDIIFIKQCLSLIPYNERKAILERYASTWLSAMGNSDIVHLRQNKGRSAANKQLREMIDERHS